MEHQDGRYGWVTNAVPQDPVFRVTLNLRFSALSLLITLKKLFVILSWTLCFTTEVL